MSSQVWRHPGDGSSRDGIQTRVPGTPVLWGTRSRRLQQGGQLGSGRPGPPFPRAPPSRYSLPLAASSLWGGMRGLDEEVSSWPWSQGMLWKGAGAEARTVQAWNTADLVPVVILRPLGSVICESLHLSKLNILIYKMGMNACCRG